MGKRYYFEEIVNFRDLGGYNTKTGKLLKEGRIFRSSMLFGPSKSDLSKWKNMQITTIIDLRAPKELVTDPNPYANFVSHYFNVNISGSQNAGRASQLAKVASSPYFMSDRYLEYVAAEENIAKACRVFLNHKDKPIVFHCSAEKDRTGVLSYLLLSLHEVLLPEIIADYQVSYTYIKHDPRILNSKNNLNVYISYPEIIEIFDTEFIKKYGSIEAYFSKIGFSSEEIIELKQLLL
ncbi:tyrosine-protein phosphatase [Alkalibacterium sp. 20]|uniref:tyrosine-protein phosphatase n=1 Tax=Alkalibacterium sp. 20 TaxID=1798803 RepID=UPI0009000B1B|nr:tyrosine-protein phosphatase [Alkalibacterium sp. 20]OJF90326.1 hypothetical protein AX762_04380 [Alkalibacterium sp. 20]